MIASVACSAAVTAAPGERAIMLREATIYISPDTGAQKLGTAGRGREVAGNRGMLHGEG